ncbi:MAG: penicillin-insensitive murein endopeptidase [Bdellovibrio sp.]
MKKHLLSFTFIAITVFVGCAPDSRNQGSKAISTTKTPQNEPEAPMTIKLQPPKVVKEDGFKIARGATQVQDMNVIYDSVTKGMKLKGKLAYAPVNGNSPRLIDVDLAGVLNSDGFIPMSPVDSTVFKNGEVLRAKATCLSEEGHCEKSFIDIYLLIDGIVYHHQIESNQETKPEEKKEDNKEEKNQEKAKEPQATGSQKDTESKKTEKKNEISTGEDQFESEDETDEVGDLGEYVGSQKDDIETLLNLKPEPDTESDKDGSVKDEPSKKDDAQKKESQDKDSKKDTPKKEAPPKDSSTKEIPKKNGAETKKEDNSKKNDGSKDNDSAKKDSKKVDTKKEELQKEEKTPKGDEPVQKEEQKKEEAIKYLIQAIGPVNEGHLQHASNFYEFEKKHNPAGFYVIRPERKTYFATNELLYIVRKMGDWTMTNLKNQPLYLGDLSYEKGGKLGKHKSHQNGLDADIAYYFSNKFFHGYFASAVAVDKPHASWMIDEQWKLFKLAVASQYVDRIFVHRVLKKALCQYAIDKGEIAKDTHDGLAYETLRRLIKDPKYHHNHFHLRVKCSKAQSRCRQMAEPAPGSGCF